MAIDLTARLRLVDDMTAPMRRAMAQIKQTDRVMSELSGSMAKTTRIQDMMGKSAVAFANSIGNVDDSMDGAIRSMMTYRDSAGRLRDEFGRFVSAGDRVGGSFNGIASGASRARGAVLGLSSALGGVATLAAGYGIYKGAESFLTSSIGGAAQYELATVQIEALFQDAEKARRYMERMSELSAQSPILNEQEVYDNSKSFLALTKDQKVLEDLWAVSERLAALDPFQGLSGAVLAQRELSGGDVQSLVERFELPRKVVNQWKNLPVAEQAKAMREYLDSIGFNQQFLEKTGATAAKQWGRTTELLHKGMRLIGEDALTKLKPALVEINDFLSSPRFERFADTAGTAMAEMFDDLIDSAGDAWNYLDSHYFSNPDFANLPDLSAKVSFVIEDLTSSFTEWYDRTGSAQLEMATGRVTKTILDGFEAVAPEIGKAAAKIGGQIAISMTSGYLDEMQNSVLGKAMLLSTPALNSVADTKGLYDKVSGMFAPAEEASSPLIYGPTLPEASGTGWLDWIKPDDSAYHGIDYVPRDGYTTELHKGERVLTAKENREYEAGGKGGLNIESLRIEVNAAGGDVSDPKVVDKLARQIAREVYYAQLNGA